MQFSTLRDALLQFDRQLRPQIAIDLFEWKESIDARWLDQRDAEIHGLYGVYIFADLAGEVIYIGKAQDSAFNNRVWAHFRTPSRDREQSVDRVGLKLYPQHEWKDFEVELVGVAGLIERGEVTIEALELQPSYVAGVFELFALTFCRSSEGRLPPLNRKLG